ncbi:MAG: sulfotransferase family 2 domain-containing protein [Gammaproteobacteria bacterium]
MLILEPILWSFPYEFRRLIFRVARPRHYEKLQAMREIETENGYSFKPFVEHRCIFVHIPKCAGISISKSLFDSLAGGHKKIGTYTLIFNKREFETYFKFTFIRNPWDRVASAFHFLKQGGMNNSDWLWSEKNLSEYLNFDHFVKCWLNRKNIQKKIHFVPQYKFVCGTESHFPKVDFIGFYENIEEDFFYVKNRLGINANLIEANKNQDRKRNYREYYTRATREIVENVYREDIEIFGYDFENSSLQHQIVRRDSSR